MNSVKITIKSSLYLPSKHFIKVFCKDNNHFKEFSLKVMEVFGGKNQSNKEKFQKILDLY